jgi:hypothetical protein
VHGKLGCFSKEFYVTDIQHVMQRWKKGVDNEVLLPLHNIYADIVTFICSVEF